MFHAKLKRCGDLFISREAKERARSVAHVSTSQYETHRYRSFRERETSLTPLWVCSLSNVFSQYYTATFLQQTATFLTAKLSFILTNIILYV